MLERLLKKRLITCLGSELERKDFEHSDVELEKVASSYRQGSSSLLEHERRADLTPFSLVGIFSHLVLARLSNLPLGPLSRCSEEFQRFYAQLHLDSLGFGAPSLGKGSPVLAPFNYEEVSGDEPCTLSGVTRGVRKSEDILNDVAQARRVLMDMEFVLNRPEKMGEDGRRVTEFMERIFRQVVPSFRLILHFSAYLDEGLAIVCYAQMRETWTRSPAAVLGTISSDVELMKKLIKFEQEVSGYVKASYPEILSHVFSSPVFKKDSLSRPKPKSAHAFRTDLKEPLLPDDVLTSEGLGLLSTSAGGASGGGGTGQKGLEDFAAPPPPSAAASRYSPGGRSLHSPRGLRHSDRSSDFHW
jgi:hypothetical protein